MKTLIAVFCASVAFFYFAGDFFAPEVEQGRRGRGGGQAAAVAVEVEELTQDRLVDQSVFAGSLVAGSYYKVAPKISGTIVELDADIGDTIYNGQVIARLDDDELKLAVRQAQAELEIAKANLNESESLLKIAERELQRVQTMRKQQISSESDVESAQAQFKTRLARHKVNESLVRQRKAALEAADLKLSYATLSVNWRRGSDKRFIAQRFQEEGGIISANSPLVSVVDIATLTAVVDLVEREYFRIKPGLFAEVEAEALPGCVYPATVKRIAPILDESSRQARVELELKNHDLELRPGMFVRVRVVYQELETATVAPLAALARRGNQQGVFLVDEGTMTATFVPVEAGFSEGDSFQLIAPDISGMVVTLGHHLLQDGAKVTIANMPKSILAGKSESSQKKTKPENDQ